MSELIAPIKSLCLDYVEMTDPRTVRVLEDGQGNIGVPHLIPGPDCWFVNADELKKWRASQIIRMVEPLR